MSAVKYLPNIIKQEKTMKKLAIALLVTAVLCLGGTVFAHEKNKNIEFLDEINFGAELIHRSIFVKSNSFDLGAKIFFDDVYNIKDTLGAKIVGEIKVFSIFDLTK